MLTSNRQHFIWNTEMALLKLVHQVGFNCVCGVSVSQRIDQALLRLSSESLWDSKQAKSVKCL